MKELHHGVQLLGTATLGPKGQVVIPAEAREKMGIVPGDKLITLFVAEKNSVCFVTETQMQSIIDRMGKHIDGIREVLSKDK